MTIARKSGNDIEAERPNVSAYYAKLQGQGKNERRIEKKEENEKEVKRIK